MIKACGLWRKEKEDGRSYLSGKWGPTARVLIFPNKYRGKENAPEYFLFLAEAGEKKDTGTDRTAERSAATPENDIPF